MRPLLRIAIAIGALVVISCILQRLHYVQLGWSRALSSSADLVGLQVSPPQLKHPLTTAPATEPTAAAERPTLSRRKEKVIVMARLESEDTTWVSQELADWDRAIYTVDRPHSELYVPLNKGKESMVYLTYLVDHYHDLPETIVFLHSHRDGYPKAWHTDTLGYDNVVSVRDLQLPHVQSNGYVNLRCNSVPGCPAELRPLNPAKGQNSEEDAQNAEKAYAEAWKFVFNTTDVPEVVGVACCSQFAVSKPQVLARPWEDYHRFRQWLLETPLEDEVTGRVYEYMWHVMFGKDPVYCPDLDNCYCEVYGRGC